ncbi:MAG: DUF2863 family protein [Rhodocyclaceae bacterium]|nr:MAG: DUF2863 family protein [Rhodocyclaceae bacterium]
MKRTRSPRPPRSAPDTEALLKEARALGLSSSRLEDAYWEARLSNQIDTLLKGKDDDTLNAALDHLYQSDDRGYEGLVDLVESRTESHSTGGDQGDDLLLIAIPILAWSRYSIPSGPVSAAILTNVRTQLMAHVLAADTRLALANALFSPDQIPPGFSATARFTGQLGRAAQQNVDFHVDAGQLPEAMHFLSDNRYILAAVAVKHGAPIFRWQEQDGDREQAEAQWKQQGGEVLRPLFPGCAIEARLPLAFFSACRDTDRAARGYAIQASVAFLNATFPEAADQLQAVIAPFHERRLTEYRIGFTLADGAKVVHGVVWPLLDAEDENSDVPGQVESILTAAGVNRITSLDHAFPAEYCDDCGAPYYPNQDGETVHAEMPEEEGTPHSRHLH